MPKTPTPSNGRLLRRALSRRSVRVLVVLAVAAAVAGGALAFFTNAGSGSNGNGTVGTLTAATISAPATSGASITITWTSQAALGNPSLNSSITYTVERKLGAGSFAPIASGPCSGSLPYGTSSCTDTVSTSGSYTYEAIATFNTWTATSNTASVTATVATKLVFTTSAQTLTAGVTSGTITVQRQDGSNTPATAGTTTVDLSTTSTGGVFRDTTDSTTITQVTIPDGSSSASFKYRDTVAGTPTIKAADHATVLTSATQTETVNPGPVNAAQSTLTPTSSSITADGAATQVLTVQAKDANGNNETTGGATVTITQQSGTGTIGSVTDNGNGTYTATVTAPASPGSGVFVATLGGNQVKSGGATQTQATVNYVAAGTETASATGPWNVATTWTPLAQTGTITTLTTSTAVTGSGTTFTNLIAGDELYESNLTTPLGQIQSITDNTHLTLTTNALAAQSAQPYTASHIPTASDAVTISGAFTVTIPSSYTGAADSLTVGNAGATNMGLTFATATSALTVATGVTVTNSTNNDMASILVAAGTLTIGGNLSVTSGTGNRMATFSVTTGTVNLAGSITLSGNNTLFTAGSTSTFNFDGSSAQTIPVADGPFGNVTINNSAGATLSAAVTTSNVMGNLQVQSGTLDNGGFAIAGNTGETFSVAAGATFRLSGTTSTFPTGFSTFTLNSASTVNYAGTGAQTVAATTSYGNLILDGGSGTKTAAAGLTVNGNLTINSGVTFAASTFSHTLKGNFTNNGTFTSTGTVTFSGTSAQTIGGSTVTTFNNLAISNSSGVSLSGVNANVGATLALGTSVLSTGSNLVDVTSTTAPTRTTGFVNGALQRTGSVSTIAFNVGNGTNDTTVTVGVSACTTCTVTVRSTAGEHPNVGTSTVNPSEDVNTYWTLASTGTITFGTVTFTYPASDVDGGATPSSFVVERWNGSAWSSVTVSGTPTSTQTAVTGLTSATLGDFIIGDDPPAGPLSQNSSARTASSATRMAATDTKPTQRIQPHTTATDPTAETPTTDATPATATTPATTDSTTTDTTSTTMTTDGTTDASTTATEGLSTPHEALLFALLGGSMLGLVALLTMPIPRRRRARRRSVT